MQLTVKKKNPIAYAILAIFVGPLSLLFINVWMALFVLCMPIVFCTLVGFYFLDGNLNVLSQYLPSLLVWASAYWLMCIALAYKGANWHNQLRKNIRNTVSKSKELIPDEMKMWLLENPEATVNDYYAIVGRAQKETFRTYVGEHANAKVIYSLSMK